MQPWNLKESENISKPLKDKDYSPRIIFPNWIPLIFEFMKIFITVFIIILKHSKEPTCPTEVKQLSKLGYVHVIYEL